MLSIIGTRPQYVKVKPIYDYCLQHNIKHTVLDTNQHYSNAMSKDIIKNLGINNISNLGVTNTEELNFMSNLIAKLYKYLYDKRSQEVLVYGDTNSTFCTALVCYKLGIKFGHVEAGARCFNNRVPEEINRLFVDSVANVGFCFADQDLRNISNGVLSGDLEYELLNTLNLPKPSYEDPVILTVHRRENLKKDRINNILNFCKEIPFSVLWPIHHSVSNAPFFKRLVIPKNVSIVQPLNYTKMANSLNQCKFIVSDSGGLLKTAPFFGKKILILRKEVGRTEVIESGYGKFANLIKEDIDWALDKIEPDRNFFLYNGLPSKCIVETMNG